jgi:RNA polymerase sigma factor FliA
MMQDCIAVYGEPALQTPTREQLIMEHLPQVRWIATRIHEKLPSTFALEDLISTGIIGLINAIDNYDPTHSAQLKTFAEFKIRGAILDSLRGLDGIPAHRRKDVKLMEAAINSLEQRLGRTPREEEIAAELSMPLAHYQNWLLDLRAVHIGSLDAEPRCCSLLRTPRIRTPPGRSSGPLWNLSSPRRFGGYQSPNVSS